jgi:hypothetical protein
MWTEPYRIMMIELRRNSPHKKSFGSSVSPLRIQLLERRFDQLQREGTGAKPKLRAGSL